MTSENNKRIAKNTAMLYIRMLLTMAVTLYTSRIVLKVIGVEDFGIYNVVGGFVTMFGFINSAMASATQRFLSFEIGRKDMEQLKNMFSMSVNIHFIIAIAIFIFAETIGLWFVKTKLTIPPERTIAALWVYQFSILALMVNMVSVPYNAIIIAHERMNVFAWVSIFEVSLKLIIVFMLVWFGFDKLKLYAILMFGVVLIIRLIYGIYCGNNFKESKFKYYWNKPLFKKLINYAGWNLWGNAASVIMGQGVNILLNIFFGPAINAARAIAYHVSVAVNSFVQNFQMALNPQIIKSYSANNLKYMHLLIFQGAKYSFFLLFALSLPILLETEIILKIWLKIVPEYTVTFTQLVIINILIDSISGPLMTAAHASGRIKLYQGVVGGMLLLILPVSYIFLKFGFAPEVTLYISIAMSFIALFVRLRIVSRLVNLSFGEYFINVIFRIIPVSIITIILTLIIQHFLAQGFFRLVIVFFSAEISIIIAIYLLGLQRHEQQFIQTKLKYLLFKNK
jgi:O-antigen/teichoic acid export membrane protein